MIPNGFGLTERE